MMHEMRVLNSEGDISVTWDEEKQASVKAAEAYFNVLKSEGFTFFQVPLDDPEKGQRITKFDPDTEGLVIAVPRMSGG
jgi:hypothetical protein